MPVIISYGNELAAILATLPKSGPLFPVLINCHERHRAETFSRRCRILEITGVSLHSYRYLLEKHTFGSHDTLVRLWKSISMVFVVVATLAVGVVLWQRQKEPVYEGYPLKHWAAVAHQTKSNSDMESFKQAVRTLGTNAIPPLLELLASEYPDWKRKMYSTPGLRAIQWDSYFPDEHDLTGFGVDGFELLGANATSAIPELTRLMNQANAGPEGPSRSAAYALGCIGTEAIPSIVAALTNARPAVRTSALIFGCLALQTNATPALPLIKANLTNVDARERFENTAMLALLAIEPETSVPALQTRLRDTVPRIRYAAIEGLTKFGTNAASAAGDLAVLRTDPDPIIRALTHAALQKIAPGSADSIDDDEQMLPAGYESPLYTLP